MGHLLATLRSGSEPCAARSTAGALGVFDGDFFGIDSGCFWLVFAPGSAVSLGDLLSLNDLATKDDQFVFDQ